MRRLLDSISRGDILSIAKRLHEPWETFTAVTLTDGETIVGHLGGSRPERWHGIDIAQVTPTRDTWRFLTDSDLVLCHRDLYTELRFYIPLTDIAGVRSIDISQPRYEFQEDYLSQYAEDERPLRAAIRDRQAADLHREFERRQAERDREFERRMQELRSGALESKGDSDDQSQGSSLVDDELEKTELDVLGRNLVGLLRSSALNTAMGHHYKVSRWVFPVSYSLTLDVSFIGDFKPAPSERLYVDWDYVSRNRRGIDGAGFGFIVSLSLQWNTSHAGAAKRLAKKNRTDLRDVCMSGLVLVRGHVAFLEVAGSSLQHDAIASGNELSMDGGTWRAAIICTRPIVQAPDRGTPWVLSYWKKGSDEVPFELLDNSVLPLDIFGSVHSAKSRTSFGDANCFLKVHYVQAAEA